MRTVGGQVSAGHVLSVLHGPKGPLGPPAHAVLREVANATGGRLTRFADSVVVSCWPSRGLWFGGVEVKVKRSDWLAELANPEKSAAVQQYCKYWWLAAPPGVVDLGEVPETWGLYVVDNKKATLAKKAPDLPAVAPTLEFVASVLRNSERATATVIQHAVDAALKAERANVQKELEAASENRQLLTRLKNTNVFLERERDDLRSFITEFERGVGGGFWMNRHRSTAFDEGRLFSLARGLKGFNCEYLIRTLESLLKDAKEIRQLQEQHESKI